MRTHSFMELIARQPWFRNNTIRRGIFAAVLLVIALLIVFPRRYVSNVKLASQQINTAGLGSALVQFGGNGLLNGALPVELDVAIGRSFDIQAEIVRSMGLVKGNGPDAVHEAVQKLRKRMRVDAIRGNILSIEIASHDEREAMALMNAYTKAMQRRLAKLSREQTGYKQHILEERLADASERVKQAEEAITAYRRVNQLIEPTAAFRAVAAQTTQLQAQLQAKQIVLQTALRFNGEDSYQVKAIRAEMAAIRANIARASGTQQGANGPTAAAIAPRAFEFERLNRRLGFAQALFDSYTRYAEGAALEELTADFNMQVIEGPYLEPGLQPNLLPMTLWTIVALLAIGAEFYMLRPPTGSRVYS